MRSNVALRNFPPRSGKLASSFALDDLIRELVTFLILVKMIHGHLPHPDLLRRHNLEGPFGLLAKAVRTGDLRLFSQVLEANQSFYMQKQLYLIIQMQLRNLILRSFWKKLYLIGLAMGAHAENRLNLRLVETAFRALGIAEMTLDEVECLTANLIYNVTVDGSPPSLISVGLHQGVHFTRKEPGRFEQKKCLSGSLYISVTVNRTLIGTR